MDDNDLLLNLIEELKGLSAEEITQLKDKIDLNLVLKGILESAKNIQATIEEIIIKKGESKKFTIDKRKARKKERQDIIIKGTALLFTIRKFLLEEEIEFLVAGTYKDKKSGEYKLKEKKYTQNQIFGNAAENLMFSLRKNGVIELNSSLESLKNLELMENEESKKWNTILKYGWIDKDTPRKMFNDNEKEGGFYRKGDKDTYVYAKFITQKNDNKRIFAHYYYSDDVEPKTRKDLDSGKYYNKGWLYQFSKINSNIYIDETEEHPLVPLMQQGILENLPGIKGGDWGNIQLKHQNSQIISLNNVYDVIVGKKGRYKGIIPTIENFLKATSEEEKIGHLKDLSYDFIDTNKSELKDRINQTVDDLLEIKRQ